jgi:beta-galactosidase
VAINGTSVVSNLSDDNYLKPIEAYSTKTTVTAREGNGITISFTAHQGDPILNGIQIKKLY